jgi:hypothetical protein
MRPLTFHYSLYYDDLMSAATGAFSDWVEHELSHGGTSAQRIDYKFIELVAQYVPTSPRQLMELAMQCEALLDVEIDDPIFGHEAEDAYEALRIAISRQVATELEMHWEARKETLKASHHVIPLPLDGLQSNGTSNKTGEGVQDSL